MIKIRTSYSSLYSVQWSSLWTSEGFEMVPVHPSPVWFLRSWQQLQHSVSGLEAWDVSCPVLRIRNQVSVRERVEDKETILLLPDPLQKSGDGRHGQSFCGQRTEAEVELKTTGWLRKGGNKQTNKQNQLNGYLSVLHKVFPPLKLFHILSELGLCVMNVHEAWWW